MERIMKFEGKCPVCNDDTLIRGTSLATLVYYPPIYKDGENINPDMNVSTTNFTCVNNGHEFIVKSQHGKDSWIDGYENK